VFTVFSANDCEYTPPSKIKEVESKAVYEAGFHGLTKEEERIPIALPPNDMKTGALILLKSPTP